MANVKKISHPYNFSGRTLYCIIRQDSTGHFLNDADGAFAAAPADKYISLTENAVLSGLYELSESRTVWADGNYTITIYRQSGGSPVPASDAITGSGVMAIVSDTEVTTAVASSVDAKTIVDRAKIIVQDTSAVRWTDSEWLEWLNAGQLETAMKRPDSSSKRQTVLLAVGTVQTIPSDGIALIDIIRNMGSGSTPGAAINRMERTKLDALIPDWHTHTAGTPKYFDTDPLEPRTFIVYPPSTATYVQMIYGAIPATVSNLSVGTKITIKDQFANALLEYLLFRAFAKQSGEGSDVKSGSHYNAFIAALGGTNAA